MESLQELSFTSQKSTNNDREKMLNDEEVVEEWLSKFYDFDIVASFSEEQFHRKNAYCVILHELLFKKPDLAIFKCLNNGLALQAQEDETDDTRKILLVIQCLTFLWELHSGLELPIFARSQILEINGGEENRELFFNLCQATENLSKKFQECWKIVSQLNCYPSTCELLKSVIETSPLKLALSQTNLSSSWAFCELFSTEEKDTFLGLMTIFAAFYTLLTPTWSTQLKKFANVTNSKTKVDYWSLCQDYFAKIESEILRLSVLEYCWTCLFCQTSDIQVAPEEDEQNDETRRDQSPASGSVSPDRSRNHKTAIFAVQDKNTVKSVLTWINAKLSELSESTVSSHKQRHRRLLKYVSEGLWRLELIRNHHVSCSRLVLSSDLPWYQNNSEQDSVTKTKRNRQRKSDRERQSSSGSSSYRWSSGEGSRSRSVHSPPYRPRLGQDATPGSLGHQGLIPRLLASPAQLMASCMAHDEQAEAVQVAQLYDLWDTECGQELRFNRAFGATVKRLSQISNHNVAFPIKLTSRQKSDTGNVSDSATRIATPKRATLSKIREATSSALRTLSLTATVDSLIASETPPQLLPSSESEGLVDGAFLVSCDMACQAGIPWSSVLTLLQSIGGKLQNVPSSLSNQNKFSSFFNTLRRWQRLVTTLGEINASHAFTDQLIPSSQASFLTVPYSDSNDLQALADWLDIVNNELKADGVGQNSSQFFLRLNEGLVKYSEKTESQQTSNQYMLQLSLYVSIVQALSSTCDYEGRLKTEPQFIFNVDVEETVTEMLSLLPEVPPALAKGIQILGMSPAVLMVKKCWPSITQPECKYPVPSPWLEYLQASCPSLAKLVQALDTKEGQSTSIQRYRALVAQSKDECYETDSGDEILNSSDFDEPIVKDQLGTTILASLDASLREKLNPLVNSPLLILEQLLMNEELGAASLVTKTALDFIKNSNAESSLTVDDFEILVLEYAGKALDVILPSKNPPADQESSPSPPRKAVAQGDVYVLPPAVPPRDEWIPDIQEQDCMCCKTTRFSMFQRRHHCRRCGRVVCKTCSPFRVPIQPYAPLAVRVCIQCYHAMQEGREDTAEKKETKSLSESHHMTWRLYADDPALNALVRRDFSYEYTPMLTMSLSLVDLLPNSSSLMVAQFLRDQSTRLLSFIKPSCGQSEVDPGLILHLVRSLLLAAKLRYASCVPATSKVHSGIQACEALLAQVDLYTVLISAQCLHLLPSQTLHNKDAGRHLCAALVREELWSLSLDLSTKCGLDPSSIWASWGLVYLRAGRLQAARQRFERCLGHSRIKHGKEGVRSPILNEIVSTLETLALEVDNQYQTPLTGNAVQENYISTSHLERIAAGQNMLEPSEFSVSNVYLEEAVYYLTEYGKMENCLAFLAKYGKWRQACQLLSKCSPDLEAFYQNLFLPALRMNMLATLVEEMRRSKKETRFWKGYIEHCYVTMGQNGMQHSLLAFQEVLGDWLGATLTATSKLFCNRPRNLDELLFHKRYMKEGLLYLEKTKSDASGLYRSTSQVSVEHLDLVLRLQNQVLELWEHCSPTQFEENIPVLFGLSRFSSHQTYIPTLLSERNVDCELVAALLLLTALDDSAYFQLALRVCERLALDCFVVWGAACEVYVMRGFMSQAWKLLSYTRSIGTALSSQELDSLVSDLLRLATRLGASPVDMKTGVGLIQRIDIKIQCLLDVGWFKAAYLEAVQASQPHLIESVLEQARAHQQESIAKLCQRWLEKRMQRSVSEEGTLSERTNSTIPIE